MKKEYIQPVLAVISLTAADTFAFDLTSENEIILPDDWLENLE